MICERFGSFRILTPFARSLAASAVGQVTGYANRTALPLAFLALLPMVASAQLIVEPEAKEILSELAASAARPRIYSLKSLIEIHLSTSRGREYLNQLIDGEFKRSGEKVSAFCNVQDIVNNPDYPEGLTPGTGDTAQTTRATTLDGTNYCVLTEKSNYVIKARRASGKIPIEYALRSIDSEYWDPVAQLFTLRTSEGNVSPDAYLKWLTDRVDAKAHLSLRESSDTIAVLDATIDDQENRVFAQLTLGRGPAPDQWAIKKFVVFAVDSSTILEEFSNEWKADESGIIPVSYSYDRYSLVSAENRYNLVASVVLRVGNFDPNPKLRDEDFDCDSAFAGIPNTNIDDVEKRPDMSDPKWSKTYPLPKSVGQVPWNVTVQRNGRVMLLTALASLLSIVVLASVLNRRGAKKPKRR
jgi:hypothetical protein